MSKITRIIDIKVVGTQELQDLEKAILANEQKLKNMNAASKKNAGMQKIHAKNIVDTKLKLKQLRAERNAEQKAVIASQQATVKLDGSYNSLVARNKQLLTAMKASTGGINSNSAEMKKMKAEYTANNGKLKEFDKSLGNNFRNVGNYSGALQGAKEKLAAVGLAVGGAVIAFQAISRVVQQVTGDFGEFEKGFTNVLSLLSSDDVNKFGETLKTGAIEVMQEFGLEIGDMNKALFDAVSAGVPAGEAIDFLRTASELAIGGVTDLTTATDGITTVLNAYQLESAEATEVASAFFSAQKFGKTTVEELSQTIGTVAPIAKQAGLGYKELLSAMAVLTKQGLNTNLATTALRSTITALKDPSEDAKKEFERLGITYGATKIQSVGLMNVLKQISAAAEDDADALGKLIPNVRALTGVGALGTAQLEDYDNILQQVNTDYGENSSLAAAVGLQQETLEQSQNRLNAEFRAQKILLGEELKPVFQTFINILTFFVDKLGFITATLKTGVIAFTAYNVALGLTKINLNSLGKALTFANIKQKILNITVKANPYVLAATAIATLVGAIFSFGKETEETVEKTSALEAATEKFNNRSKQQIGQTEKLLKLARDESASISDRQKAIGLLNERVTEFNGTLDLQNVKSEDAANAMARYTASILESASVDAAREAIVTLNRDLEEQQTLFNDFAINAGITAAQNAKVGDSFDENSQALNPYAAGLEKVKTDLAEATDIIFQFELKQAGLNKALTTGDIANKTYENSLAGLTKKVSDYKIALQNATFNTGEHQAAVDGLAKAEKALSDAKDKNIKKSLTAAQVDALSENTLREINKKKAELNRLLLDENIGNDESVRIKKELIRLDEVKAKGDIVTSANKEDLISKLKREIAEQKNLLLVLGDSAVVADERATANATLLQKEIDLILAKQVAGQEMSSDDLNQIAILKNEIDNLNGKVPEGEDNPMVKLFGGGEAGAEAFANTMTSLNSINGLISARANLQNKETEERIKGINLVEATELKALRDSAKFKAMTDEQKEAAEAKITKKADAERQVFEKAAFERNKKASKQQAIISGAQAIMKIAAQYAFPFSLIPMAAQAIMTKLQLQTIEASTFAQGGLLNKYAQGGELSNGGVFTGASHKNGGIKFHTGGRLMEAEGGEAIINKESTAMFRNELSAINQAGGGVKFADGGLTRGLDGVVQTQLQSSMSDEDVSRISQALSTQEIIVTEQSISSTQRQVNVLEQRMSF
jgi:TP901 family phage tail tape measure protein